MKKIIVLLWFGLCAALFAVALHPLALQRALPYIAEDIQSAHDVIRPFFFRPTKL